MEVEDGIKVSNQLSLKTGRLSLSMQVCPMGSQESSNMEAESRRESEKEVWQWEQSQKDAVFLALMMEGDHELRMQAEVTKGKKMDSFLEPPERNTAQLTP